MARVLTGTRRDHLNTRTSMHEEALRSHLARMLVWGDAHATFETAVAGLHADLRGVVPEGAAHSAWQLLEHLRLTQRDILEFCRNPAYQEPRWPDDYWPDSAAPPGDNAWDASISAFLRDRDELVKMAEDPTVDLFGTIPHGTGQTYLRELLLVADHSAHHIGALILLRRLLGAWPPN